MLETSMIRDGGISLAGGDMGAIKAMSLVNSNRMYR
jgi:hypothetical protein